MNFHNNGSLNLKYSACHEEQLTVLCIAWAPWNSSICQLIDDQGSFMRVRTQWKDIYGNNETFSECIV